LDKGGKSMGIIYGFASICAILGKKKKLHIIMHNIKYKIVGLVK